MCHLSFVVLTNSRTLRLLNASKVVIDWRCCLVSLIILVTWALILLLGHWHIALLLLATVIFFVWTSLVHPVILSIIRMHSMIVSVASGLFSIVISSSAELVDWIKRCINFKNSFNDSYCLFSLKDASLNVEDSEVFYLSSWDSNVFKKLTVMFCISRVQVV